jgi:hypothetical protein
MRLLRPSCKSQGFWECRSCSYHQWVRVCVGYDRNPRAKPLGYARASTAGADTQGQTGAPRIQVARCGRLDRLIMMR